jgi:hypothetical protein
MAFFFQSKVDSADLKADDNNKKKPTKAADPNWVKAVLSRAHITTLKGGGRSGTHSVIREKLVGGFVISGASNSNAFGSQALSPIAVQDWSGFAALFDIARVIRLKVVMIPATSGAVTAVGPYWIAAWDPSNLSAYSTSSDELTAERFIGPIAYNAVTNPVQVISRTGTYSLNIILPAPKQQIANNNASAGVVGGGWFATSDTNYICGWLKTFLPACGTGVTPSIFCNVFYDVEFASRT